MQTTLNTFRICLVAATLVLTATLSHAGAAQSSSPFWLAYRVSPRPQPGYTGALRALAVDATGRVYATDSAGNRVVVLAPDGTLLRSWGDTGGGEGQFDSPTGIALAPDGSVVVADASNNRVQRFASDGRFLTAWGEAGSGPGLLSSPWDVAVAPNGTVYVADTGNSRVQYFAPDGTFQGMWGAPGSGPGQMSWVTGVATTPEGNVCIADSEVFANRPNDRVQCFSADGAFLRQWGGPGIDPGQFMAVAGLDVARDGTIYTVEANFPRVQRFDRDGNLRASIDTEVAFGVDTLSAIAVAPSGDAFVLGSGLEVGASTAIWRMPASLASGSLWSIDTPELPFNPWRRWISDLDVDSDRGVVVTSSGPFDPRYYRFDHSGVFVSEVSSELGSKTAIDPSGVAYSVTGSSGWVNVPPKVTRYDLRAVRPLEPWDLSAVDPRFNPSAATDLAFSPAGRLLVSDRVCGGEDCQLRVLALDSVGAIEQVALVPSASQYDALSMSVSPSGHIVLTQDGSPLVQVIDIDTGAIIDQWGRQGDEPDAFGPHGAGGNTVDAAGTVYAIDNDRQRILSWSPSGEFTGAIGPRLQDGTRLEHMTGLATTPNGELVIRQANDFIVVGAKPLERWRTEIYPGPWWSGHVAAVSHAASVDQDWTAALRPSLRGAAFSARMTGDVETAAGGHAMVVRSDGPVRLWVDGHLVLERLGPGPPVQHVGVGLARGWHRVQLDVSEPGDATQLVIRPSALYLPVAAR